MPIISTVPIVVQLEVIAVKKGMTRKVPMPKLGQNYPSSTIHRQPSTVFRLPSSSIVNRLLSIVYRLSFTVYRPCFSTCRFDFLSGIKQECSGKFSQIYPVILEMGFEIIPNSIVSFTREQFTQTSGVFLKWRSRRLAKLSSPQQVHDVIFPGFPLRSKRLGFA